MKKFLKSTVSTIALITTLTYLSPVYAISNKETVYSKLDANGDNYKTIVTTKDGENVEQKETDKDLPLVAKITYTLDGKEIKADDLAGKSGKVKIKIEYENKSAKKVTINGKEEIMYTPFVVALGTIIDGKNNKNIKVTDGGRIVENGDKIIVVGLVFPGLDKSLDLSGTLEKIEIPDSIEITMDATNFEMKNILTYATPKIFSEEIDWNEFDDLFDKVNELQTGINKIEKGADSLKDGINELNSGSKTLNEGAQSLSTGALNLSDGASKVNTGAKSLNAGIKDLQDGLKSAGSGITSLKDGSSKVATGASSVDKGANSLKTGIDSLNTQTKELAKGMMTISKSVEALNTGASSLKEGMNQLAKTLSAYSSKKEGIVTLISDNEVLRDSLPNTEENTGLIELLDSNITALKEELKLLENASSISSLVKGANDIADGIDSLNEGTKDLPEKSKKLTGGVEALATGAKDLVEGTKSLSVGASSLNDGANWNNVTENTSNLNVSVSGDNLRLKIVPNNNYSVDYAGIGLNLDGTVNSQLSNYGLESDNGYSVPANVESVALEQVEFRYEPHNDDQHGNEGEGAPEFNTFAKVTIHIDGEELEYDKPWSEDAADFIFGINNSPEMRRLAKNEVNYIRENDKIVGLETKEQIDYQYDYNNEETVTFHIRTQLDDFITSLKINGESYNTPQTKEALADAFSGWGIAFDVQNVPYAETYDIEVVGRKQTEEEKVVGNFAWTYDENSNEYSEDDKILHGTLDFVKAVYSNDTYTTIEQINNAGDLFVWDDGIRGTDNPTGEALFPTGTVLTLRLTPDAGYQLTSFDLNGFPFEAGEEVGLYTFTIGGGNWHLGAHFTEVSDEVQANSQNIKSGNIDINKSENENFGNGTAKLEVNDVASMSPNRMEEFENTATEEGYELESYLDISLYNSIYKGGNKDANGNYESWDTPVEKIEDNATITLELENNMSGKELAIIHEKHTGNTITGYELIDATYNEENNTITFETDSFSNYAIVSKENTETENTETENTEIEKYVLTSGNATFTFTDEANHDFEVLFMDVLTLTDEELASLDITREEFAQILDMIKENTTKHGTLLSVYNIEIEDANLAHTGKTEIKIKMTDEMKKYNTFKLIYLDDENNFKVGDIVELKINGEYIEGTLPHLSAYALVGSNIETTSPSTEEKTTDTSSNPTTGDNIIMIISIFAIATFGVFTTIKVNKNRRIRKH